MRVLVCGGRDYQGRVDCLSTLDISLLIHGGARGADLRSASYVKSQGIHAVCVDALWNYYGKSAGFRRNSTMLLLQPEYCVAFPGGAGTNMMVSLCEKQNITVWKPYE